MKLTNKSIRTTLIASSLLIINQFGHTANVLKEINLELYGNIRIWACGIMSSEDNRLIDLGKHSLKNLSSIDDRSTAIPISLSLSNCPPNGTVNISVIGNIDKTNNELLAVDEITNAAKNIAIEIRDKDKKRVPIGTKKVGLNTDSSGNLSTVFYANYIVTKPTVEAGAAKSKMQFIVEYE